MSNIADYLARKLFDHLFAIETFDAPASLYIGLLTAAPTNAGAYTELDKGGYSRQLVVFERSSDRSYVNDAELVFGAATEDWTTVTHIGVFDGGTTGAGNLLTWTALSDPELIRNGQQLSYPIHDIILRFRS